MFLFEKETHSKLIVWIHRSLPHGPGIVKTLHVVGLVEAVHDVQKKQGK